VNLPHACYQETVQYGQVADTPGAKVKNK